MYSMPFTKPNSQWIKNLNAKLKTTELLEENIEENLCDCRSSNNFLDMVPKAESIKEPTNKLRLHQNENIGCLEEVIKRMKS